MIIEFETITQGVTSLVKEWEPRLTWLSEDIICQRINNQGRTIKQIVGHMVDSASNNTHRIVHLQYQQSPLSFPNYATNGNNDRWIAIQDYQHEDWSLLVNLWKYTNLHFVHAVNSVDSRFLQSQWICGGNEQVSLYDMVIDYLPHLRLHLNEVEELLLKKC